VKLQNSFHVDLPPQAAWATLLDIPSVVPCMPGAELLEAEDDRNYRGQVKVKLGPVAVAFKGRARLVEVDEANHRVRVNASGTENKGRGSAQADVVFTLVPDGDATRVDIVTDLSLAGAVAQYGRAQGVIADVSRTMIDRFASNLQARIGTSAASAPSGAGEASAAPAPSSPSPPAPAPALSIFTIIAAVIRGWFARRKETRS
jgi:carbon monoxide dehydrogenase subunit G